MKNIFIVILLSLFFTVIFSANQIHAKIAPKDTIALWLFDEGSGKNFEDSSGNKNSGTIENPNWVNGKYGKALEFKGSTDYGIVPHNELFNFGTGDFSMGCWMNSKNMDAYVVIKRNGGASWWALSSSIDRNAGCFIFEGGGVHLEGVTKITDAGWHHCVAIRKNGVVSIFVDGVLEREESIPANMDCTGPVRIGGWGSENYIGIVDEVFITKFAISVDDIKDIMKGWGKISPVQKLGKLPVVWGSIKCD